MAQGAGERTHVPEVDVHHRRDKLSHKERTSSRLSSILHLLPDAPLPQDLAWASPNPRIAKSVAKWAAAVEKESEKVITPTLRLFIEESLAKWQNEKMPLSLKWVEDEIKDLNGLDKSLARLILVLAKAPYQVSDTIVNPVRIKLHEKDFIRALAWGSYIASRRLIAIISDRVAEQRFIKAS